MRYGRSRSWRFKLLAMMITREFFIDGLKDAFAHWSMYEREQALLCIEDIRKLTEGDRFYNSVLDASAAYIKDNSPNIEDMLSYLSPENQQRACAYLAALCAEERELNEAARKAESNDSL